MDTNVNPNPNPIIEGGNIQGLILSVFKSLSLYSPVIIVMCMFFISIVSNSEMSFVKPFIYLGWFFIATGFRYLVARLLGATETSFDGFYSTYILSFTFFYLIFPLILVNMGAKSSLYNWKSILFFVFYIIYDISFKVSNLSVEQLDVVNRLPIFQKILGELFSGSAMGIAVSSAMYFINEKLLYINELASNGSVTTLPTNQQMKCRV